MNTVELNRERPAINNLQSREEKKEIITHQWNFMMNAMNIPYISKSKILKDSQDAI